ncbi:MAG: isoaspartyl peptidase/L-asparaginase [Saprospiraceae bacterium]
MKFNLFFLSVIIGQLLFSCKTESKEISNSTTIEKPAYAIVIHGGAGTISRGAMSAEKEKEYRDALSSALQIGENILKTGGTALDAVEKTINLMEDSPLFNSGKGAVFTHDKTNEMDASIMSGINNDAGAVGGVMVIKNPISAARAVMEKSKHVMMVGHGAEEFAKSRGLEIVDPSYFKTKRSWETINRVLDAEKASLSLSTSEIKDSKYGTVGCVALDNNGNLAAGTSTGGMTNKMYNRIGDSPIIGAGTYADNNTCGVSCTGHGEYFIRYTVARDIAAMMEYGKMSLAKAAEYIINKKLVEKGGSGGVIALDKNGNITMPFNTSGMYRGYAKPGDTQIMIYKDEK